jgi:hypothetical protein
MIMCSNKRQNKRKVWTGNESSRQKKKNYINMHEVHRKCETFEKLFVNISECYKEFIKQAQCEVPLATVEGWGLLHT